MKNCLTSKLNEKICRIIVEKLEIHYQLSIFIKQIYLASVIKVIIEYSSFQTFRILIQDVDRI